jgi:hypothetical protein
MNEDYRTPIGGEFPTVELRAAHAARRDDEGDRLVRMVAAGARAVWDDDEITAVHVVLPKQSSYRTLVRSRRLERPGQLRMTVREDRGVTIQLRHDGASDDISAPPTNDQVPPHRWRQSWPLLHEPAWLHRLMTMTEGVR